MTLFGHRTLLAAGLLASILLLAGCGRGNSPAVSEEAGASSTERPGSHPVSDRPAADSPAVTILPPLPKAGQDLRAEPRNCSGLCRYTWMKNGEVLEGDSENLLSGGSLRKGDEISVRVEAGNGSTRATTIIGNTPPRVAAFTLRDPKVRAGSDLEVFPEGTDSDGDRVEFRFRWSINGEEYGWIDGPVLSGDRFRKGDRIEITVIPFDGEEEGTPFAGGELVVPDTPPRFVTEPPREFEGFNYSYDAEADDPDGDILTYSLEKAPKGMAIDGRSGHVQWTIGQEQAGEHLVRVVAQDEEGMKAVQEYTLALTIPEKVEN